MNELFIGILIGAGTMFLYVILQEFTTRKKRRPTLIIETGFRGVGKTQKTLVVTKDNYHQLAGRKYKILQLHLEDEWLTARAPEDYNVFQHEFSYHRAQGLYNGHYTIRCRTSPPLESAIFLLPLEIQFTD